MKTKPKSKGLLERAVDFAYEAHKGQLRKDSGIPYICHPIDVMHFLKQQGIKDEEILASAILHDVLEDTPTSEETLLELFGERVTGFVLELTKPDDDDKHEYLVELAENASPEALFIKFADRVSNTNDFDLAGKPTYAYEYAMRAEDVYKKLLSGHSNHISDHVPDIVLWFINILDGLPREGEQNASSNTR